MARVIPSVKSLGKETLAGEGPLASEAKQPCDAKAAFGSLDRVVDQQTETREHGTWTPRSVPNAEAQARGPREEIGLVIHDARQTPRGLGRLTILNARGAKEPTLLA